jgi:hypothetical protein
VSWPRLALRTSGLCLDRYRHTNPLEAMLKMFESCCSAERQMPSVCQIAAVVLGSVTLARGWLCSTMKKLLIYEGMWTTMQQCRPICLAASHTISVSLSFSHTLTNRGGLNKKHSLLQMTAYFSDIIETPKIP